jgi:hypothetical protein
MPKYRVEFYITVLESHTEIIEAGSADEVREEIESRYLEDDELEIEEIEVLPPD